MHTNSKILIADDEKKIRKIISDILGDEGYSITECENGDDALDLIKRKNFNLVLLDLKMPGIDGLEVLQKSRSLKNPPPVIMITAHGSVPIAVKAVQSGAFDFIEKPVEMERLLIAVRNALLQNSLERENKQLRKRSESEFEIIGKSDIIVKIKKRARQAANTDARVLITGENGTGKDLIAHYIHINSERRDQSFVVVNCAAIPENLIESELFGHEKGAFTGATQQQKGKFEFASGGTLFLNEIAEMTPQTQAKLLHAIEYSQFSRLGSNKQIKCDTRIIAATNIDLGKAITEKTFRKDLFYRLNVVGIEIPPLRVRDDDVLLLADYFLHMHCGKLGTNIKSFSKNARQVLKEYYWPGNVRELNNVVEKAVIYSSSEVIDDTDLKDLINLNFENDSLQTDKPLKAARIEWEKRYIISFLEKNNWVIKKTAAELEIERTHLHRLMKQMDIKSPF